MAKSGMSQNIYNILIFPAATTNQLLNFKNCLSLFSFHLLQSSSVWAGKWMLKNNLQQWGEENIESIINSKQSKAHLSTTIHREAWIFFLNINQPFSFLKKKEKLITKALSTIKHFENGKNIYQHIYTVRRWIDGRKEDEFSWIWCAWIWIFQTIEANVPFNNSKLSWVVPHPHPSYAYMWSKASVQIDFSHSTYATIHHHPAL
jgi:hypothetical protein